MLYVDSYRSEMIKSLRTHLLRSYSVSLQSVWVISFRMLFVYLILNQLFFFCSTVLLYR